MLKQANKYAISFPQMEFNNEITILCYHPCPYGRTASVNVWYSYMRDNLQNKMRFQYSYTDTDFWLKSNTKPDGNQYYTYIMVYIDDILIVFHDPSRYMNQLKSRSIVKPESISLP